jgi:hypothetical protein
MVVPIPWYFEDFFAMSMMSALARWMAAESRRAAVQRPKRSISGRSARDVAVDSKTFATVVVARALATLPAEWPPAPSASRKRPSSGRSRTWS